MVFWTKKRTPINSDTLGYVVRRETERRERELGVVLSVGLNVGLNGGRMVIGARRTGHEYVMVCYDESRCRGQS